LGPTGLPNHFSGHPFDSILVKNGPQPITQRDDSMDDQSMIISID
jgi:hypothetical protein